MDDVSDGLRVWRRLAEHHFEMWVTHNYGQFGRILMVAVQFKEAIGDFDISMFKLIFLQCLIQIFECQNQTSDELFIQLFVFNQTRYELCQRYWVIFFDDDD